MILSARALLLVAATALTGLIGVPRPADATGNSPSTAASGPITIVGQELALATDAALRVTVHLDVVPDASTTVHVTSYRRIDERRDLFEAIAGRLGRQIDAIDVDPAGLTIDADGNVTIDVPTESTTNELDKIQLPLRGLYPIVIDIDVDGSGGEPGGQVVTFVDRLPGADDEQLGQLSVAVLASVTADPAVPGTATPLDDATVAEIERLSQYGADVPLSVSISPEVLQRLDPATLAGLGAALGPDVVLSQPRIPFDPSAAAASDQGALFGQLLLDGESSVADAAEVPRPDRSTWYSPGPITTAGAALLRSLGVRSLVISPDTYLASDGNLGDLTDFSQLFLTRLEVPTSETETCSTGLDCMPTAVVDPLLSGRLADAELGTEQSALYLAADLVAYRDQLAASIAPVRRHGLVLGLDDGGVPDPAVVSRLVAMARATDAVDFTTLSDFDRTSSNLISDGLPRDLGLPATQPVDLTKRTSTIDKLTFTSVTVASMLDVGGTQAPDPRPAQWNATIATLWSTSITDAQVASTASSLQAAFDAIKGAVVPPTEYKFSLSGRSTSLPLRFRNTGDVPLRVVIKLSAGADKLTFPEGDRVVTLVPGTNDLKIRVVARTNGTFTVTLQVLTPNGGIPITRVVVLKAQVNALTGLAQVLTGGALMVLATWWVRHLRRGRRAKRNVRAMAEHPAMGPALGAAGVGSATIADS